MPGSVVTSAVVLLTLLAAAGAQQHSCSTEGDRVICSSSSSHVEFLNESRTWREAHELCRLRGRFLIPSRGVFFDPTLERLYQRAIIQLGTFWVGAKYLRNDYYQWLLPLHDGELFQHEQIEVSPAVDPSNLCGRVETVNNELELGWSPCASHQRVVCFSDEITDAETSPEGYQPSLTVQAGDNVFRPKADGDEVLVRPFSVLTGLQFRITCGDGDSVVKDHFVIGRTEYRSEWWYSNFTIMDQLVPPSEGNPLTVGTFWCQRYVEGAADPVSSGRLHVTTSLDIYVLTMPLYSIVSALQLLFPTDKEYEEGPGRDFSYDDYREGPQLTGTLSSGIVDIVTELRQTLAGTADGEIRFLALYDFPRSRQRRQEDDTASEGESVNAQGRIVSLVVDASRSLNGSALQRANFGQFEGSAAGNRSLRKVFRCSIEDVEGRVWRHRLTAVAEYTPSEPACVVAGLSAQVERRCRPGFDREGARWGPFCAAGVCHKHLPNCGPTPPTCPPGFTITTDAISEVPRVLCMLLVTGVTFKERALACRRREPSAVLWGPRQRLLELSFLSPPVVNQTVWLPFRRLWYHGPLWPPVQDLLSRDDRRVADLNGDLNCTVVTPRGWLASASCAERHAALCVAKSVYSGGQEPTHELSHSSRRVCQSLGLSARLANGSYRCFAMLCSNSETAVSWSEAASLCTESNSSLSSLTSQRQLDMIARLGRLREQTVRAAVNLVQRDGRVVWGAGTLLTYPALSPDLSTAEQHTRGVLDVSRGQYDFVGENERVVTCAVCDRTITLAPPDILLFYGDASPGADIFVNVTNFLRDSEEPADYLSCFVTTGQSRRSLRQGTQAGENQGGFRVTDLSDIDANDDRVFIRVIPRVDFGYLVCGVSAGSVDVVTSNALTLTRRPERTHVQEYVVGMRGGQWGGSQCDLTFCRATCPCFNNSLNTELYIRNDSSLLIYLRTMHPLRTTRSDDGRVIEHYFVTLNFNPPQRRRRQTELNGPDGARQVPDRIDGARLLRDSFSSQMDYVKHARCCPAEQTELPVPLSWPVTCSGAATSVELCVDGAGRPAMRRCLGGPLTGVQWGPVEFSDTACTAAPSATVSLHQLSQAAVTADSALHTAAKLARLTAKPAALVTQDVVSVAVTLENVQKALEGHDPHLPEVAAIQKHVVAAVSHAMDVDSATVTAATDSHWAGPRVVRALERILIGWSAESIPLITADNVAVRSGNFVGVSSASQQIDESSLRTVAKGAGRSAVFGVEAALLLEGKKPIANVVFLVYRDGRLLQSSGQRVTSQVVSALLPAMLDEDRFRSNVLLTFRSRPGQCSPTPTCAFWDAVASQWSTRGCWLEDVRNGSDVCRCNHLTNFARIFNYESDVYLSAEYHHVLDVITYLGSALSLSGLFLTMLTFVLFKKWRKPRGNQIVLHLSVALTGMYLAFLFGLAATDNHVACICLSALLHYFLLAAFGWMAVEAVFQYLRFVRVVGTYISGFMRKASLFAWGGALVPVICVLAARPHCYDGQSDVCWMDFQSLYYALVLPVLAVMTFNAVLFSMIVYSLSCGRQRGLRTNQSERQLALRRLRVAIITFILLGLPWVFGFLSIKEARVVFAVFFCVCSMLQGFAIFLLMVAGERGAQQLWSLLIAGQCCVTTDTDSSNATHSTSGGASHSLLSSSAKHDTRL